MENTTNQYLNNTSSNNDYYTPKQGRLPLFIADILDVCDPVFTFERIMKGCNLENILNIIVKILKEESVIICLKC